jgi:hypothetical protein
VLLAEGQFRHLKSTLNKPKYLKFRFGTRRPTVFKRIGLHFQRLKIFFKKKKKGHLCRASEQLRCEISSNLKHYHSYDLSE